MGSPKLVLVAMASLLGCSDHNDEPKRGETKAVISAITREAATSPPHDNLEEFQTAYKAVAEEFDDPYVAGTDQNPLHTWRAAVLDRVAKCPDPACRKTELTDATARLKFALGENSREQPFPLRHPTYAMKSTDVYGQLTVLPLTAGDLLVRIDTHHRDQARWMCSLLAAGRLGSNGTARLRAIDDFVEAEGSVFELQVISDKHVILRGTVDLSEDTVCNVGTIYGTYHAVEERRPAN